MERKLNALVDMQRDVNASVKIMGGEVSKLRAEVASLRAQFMNAASDKYRNLGIPVESVQELLKVDRLLLLPDDRQSFVSKYLNKAPDIAFQFLG
jgi:hypothetical protein